MESGSKCESQESEDSGRLLQLSDTLHVDRGRHRLFSVSDARHFGPPAIGVEVGIRVPTPDT